MNEAMIISYLQQALITARRLASVDGKLSSNKASIDASMEDSKNKDSMEIDEDEDDTILANSKAPTTRSTVESLVNQIAKCIWQAAQEETLALSPDNDWPSFAYDKQFDPHDYPNVDRGETSSLPPRIMYEYRRVDHLRHLLQALAPIQCDLAARVALYICNSLTEDDQVASRSCIRSTVMLASIWLPVAPHLMSPFHQIWNHPVVQSLGLCQSVDTTKSASVSMASSTTITVPDTPLPLLLLECLYRLMSFYDEHKELRVWIKQMQWSWTFLDHFLRAEEEDDDEGEDDQDMHSDSTQSSWSTAGALRWYAARIVAYLLNLSLVDTNVLLEKYNVAECTVPWCIHPFALDDEEVALEIRRWNGLAQVGGPDSPDNPCPLIQHIRPYLPLHLFLVEFDSGMVFFKEDCISEMIADDRSSLEPTHASLSHLIKTPTTIRNLSAVSDAMGISPARPILLSGPPGSGKSSLVRELARCLVSADTASDKLLEIHVDDETDTKTLVGSYTTTDIPGQFEWKPGALTRAVRQGQWVLFEDLDSIPLEIQASLVQLFKDRRLPLGSGKLEDCHPNFRIFATMTSDDSGRRKPGSKRVLNPSYWLEVPIDGLPLDELKGIGTSCYSLIPSFIADSVLEIFSSLRTRDRSVWTSRLPSVRDLLKAFSRIAHTVIFERNCTYATESQRTLCMAEIYDVFVMANPSLEQRRMFLRTVMAPALGITADWACSYVASRTPEIVIQEVLCEIGRVQLPRCVSSQTTATSTRDTFTQTGYTLRLLECIGVCVREQEPLLLVGETGCGKASLMIYTVYCSSFVLNPVLLFCRRYNCCCYCYCRGCYCY
jgi:energy-coupling factor transporter ATP-binding protein EcfA2